MSLTEQQMQQFVTRTLHHEAPEDHEDEKDWIIRLFPEMPEEFVSALLASAAFSGAQHEDPDDTEGAARGGFAIGFTLGVRLGELRERS